MYSPPPMDGFSPPPMSDFSPPPMEDLSPLNDFPPTMNGFSPPSDDDEGVGAEDHYDFGICDTSYDLTGLSEKMNSLEFDKIKNLPPREILELKKESSELNNLYSNNLKKESAEHMVLSENNNEGANGINKHTNGVIESDDEGDAFTSDLGEVDHCDNNPPGSSLSEQGESMAIPVSESSEYKQEETYGEKLLEYNSTTCLDLDKKCVELELQASSLNTCDESELFKDVNNIANDFVNSGMDNDEDLCEKPNPCNDDPMDDFDASEKQKDDNFEEPKTNVNEPRIQSESPAIFNQLTTSFDAAIQHKEVTDDEWGDFPEESKPDDSWGNFNEGPNESEEWGGFDHSSKIEVVTEQRTKESEVREIEFDDFSDDEFGDFGEADTKQETMAEEVHEQSLSSQLERLEGVGENLINSAFGGKTKSWSAEKISSDELDLEKNVLDDGDIFQPMENPALTPGLDYKWRDSATYTIMLYTLGIDSRVVLDGEGWRSSVPRYAPKTAATLLTPGLLTPQPVMSPGEKQEEPAQETKDTVGTSCGVSPAEFDWNNSGLTNPLEENGLSEEKNAQKVMETPKVITELLASQNKQILAEKKSLTVLQKHTSREAKNILDGFPLLNFMTSSVLMFPTKSIDKKK